MLVANTILAQLGGSKFIAMVGAYRFTAGKNNLSLWFKANAKNKANMMHIQLTPNDTYTVQFWKMRGTSTGSLKKVSQYENIYADQLRTLFEDETGLRTSL